MTAWFADLYCVSEFEPSPIMSSSDWKWRSSVESIQPGNEREQTQINAKFFGCVGSLKLIIETNIKFMFKN